MRFALLLAISGSGRPFYWCEEWLPALLYKECDFAAGFKRRPSPLAAEDTPADLDDDDDDCAAIWIALLYLSIRRNLGLSSGQKCPVLQGLDQITQLRLGGRVGFNGGVEGGPLQDLDHVP
jgi:hypothetical protein